MPELVVQVIASDPSKASAKRLLLDVDLDWTVARLKEELARRTACPAPAQKLVWRGRIVGNGEALSLRCAGIDDMRYTLFVAPVSGKPMPSSRFLALLPAAGAAVRALASAAVLLVLAGCAWHNGGSVLHARREQWFGAAALVAIVMVARQQLEAARERKKRAAGAAGGDGSAGSSAGAGAGAGAGPGVNGVGHRARPSRQSTRR